MNEKIKGKRKAELERKKKKLKNKVGSPLNLNNMWIENHFSEGDVNLLDVEVAFIRGVHYVENFDGRFSKD